MKRKFFASLLSLLLVFNLIPAVVFATTADADGTACTLTEGCTLEEGHEGDCVVEEAQFGSGSGEVSSEPEDAGGVDETGAGEAAADPEAAEGSDATGDGGASIDSEAAVGTSEAEAKAPVVQAASAAEDEITVTAIKEQESDMPALTATQGEAEIGVTTYDTLANAISAAQDGDIVSLLSDVNLTETLTISGKRLTLDLCGYTLNGRINIEEASNITIKNGILSNKGGQALNVYASGDSSNPTTVVLDSGVEIRNCAYGLCVFPEGSSNKGEGINITVNANITADAGIFVDGLIKSCASSDIITVNSTIYATDVGIAVNGAENVVLSSTTEISGSTGVEVRAGSLTVNGAAVTAEGSFSIEKNSNGTTTTGAAIAVVQHTTNLPVSVTINDGTFSGVYAVYENDIQDDVATGNVSINISGGSFTGTSAAVLAVDSGLIELSGGTYSSDVSEYVVTGKTAVDNGNGTYTIGVEESTAVAKVNGIGYSTLQASIEAAGTTSAEVTLLADTAEDITIANNQTITLDLNGCTLTNVSDHTIINYGTLTITDSGTGGTVDNVTHARGALVNYGEAYLNGGTFTRSKEAGTSASDHGGNSWYTVKNYNYMEVDGAIVENNGKYSSCFANGYYDASDKSAAQAITGDVTPELYILSGTVTGGLNSVKNDDYAELWIEGGTFENYSQCALQNHSTVKIFDGTFTGGTYVLYNCGCDETADVGQMFIFGGTFNAGDDTEYILMMVSSADTACVVIEGGTFDATGGDNAAVFGAASTAAEVTGGTINIYGGSFSEVVPAAYCGEGYEPVTAADTNGFYTVCKHSYTSDVTEPTCTEKGYTTHTCSNCGASYVDSYVDATGHTNAIHVSAEAATCTEEGNIEYWYCSDCDSYFSDADCTTVISLADTVISATGHSYSDTVTEPTCTEQGYTTHTCTECGASYVDSYANATGHINVTHVSAGIATCTEEGNIEYWYCSDCGSYFSDADCTTVISLADTVISVTGHSYSGTVTEPTCTEQGYTTHTCAECGDSYVDSYVDATGHINVTHVSARVATCTEEGNIEYWYCEDCGSYFSDADCTTVISLADTVISATGYSYSDTVTEPACTDSIDVEDVAKLSGSAATGDCSGLAL
ncbi:MAG: hypothetical protein LUD01_04280 [Clostridiales bacterium]|nr:hypothetical protein [Clostridiales bacterium]